MYPRTEERATLITTRSNDGMDKRRQFLACFADSRKQANASKRGAAGRLDARAERLDLKFSVAWGVNEG